MLNDSIFKAYDVRGVYPTDLNEETAYLIGRAFGAYAKAEKMVVGCDARLSSPQLLKSLTAGINSQSISVIDIGLCPVELIYFAVASNDFDAGIMITASHNPKQYNGFKMVVKVGSDVSIIPGRELLPHVEEIKEITETSSKKLSDINFQDEYQKYILKFCNLKDIKKFKIVIDASNGVAGRTISLLESQLPADIIKLNFDPDGNFPNHSPNPLELNARDQITEAVKENKADFGLIFDADGDRIFLIDELGNFVPADITLLFLARHFLKGAKSAPIIYNLICSRAVPQFIRKWGGKAVRTAVGFVNVQKELKKSGGAMGGELSGHYCFRDFFNMDSGIFPFLILLEVFSKDNRNISEMVKELSLYSKVAVNFEVSDKEKILEKLKKEYADGQQDFLDGITIEYSNWWFNVRPSNTEPILRLTIEADTQNLLSEKTKEIEEFINVNK
ncbi:MAG: phosphomannomutase/phosphoglucomutase [Patescibacteria group bacterium]